MLKYFIKTFYITVLFFSIPSYAQLDANIDVSLNNADTSNSSVEPLKFRFLRNNFFYDGFDNFVLNPIETDLAPPDFSPSLYKDYYRIQNAGKDNFADIKISMALRKQMDLNKDISLVQQVLGYAEAATVGYLAYRHIKKYGFK